MLILILFNLKPGVESSDYEKWLKEVDLPTSSRLSSIQSYSVFRLGPCPGDGASLPYQYAELVNLVSWEQFETESAGEIAQRLSQQWSQFAAEPVIMVMNSLGAVSKSNSER
jgi:hypothetical protein